MLKYFGFVLILFLTTAWFYAPTHKVTQANIQGVKLLNPIAVPNFNLQDSQRHSFTKTNLLKQWSLLFFGFTNCGMVCPTTMTALDDMWQILTKKNIKPPTVIFVTIDPKRDSNKRLGEYVNYFNKNFIGLRGLQTETEHLMQALKIQSIKIQSKQHSQNYTLDHSSDILIVNPDGYVVASLTYPHQGKQLAKDFRFIAYGQ